MAQQILVVKGMTSFRQDYLKELQEEKGNVLYFDMNTENVNIPLVETHAKDENLHVMIDNYRFSGHDANALQKISDFHDITFHLGISLMSNMLG